MASHLSDIGFRAESPEAFVALAERACRVGQHISVAGGVYCHWDAGEGAELWGQLDLTGRVLGANPHFGGPARMRVGLTERVTAGGGSALDGAFRGWADPPEDDPTRGSYPLLFDAPDFGTWGGLALPAIVTVQVAAFAHELTAYPSETAFEERATAQPRLASESFIPSGLFTPGPNGAPRDPPQAEAILTGRVLAAEQRVNPAGGQAFWWAQVRTFGGEIDIVADPALVRGTLAVGGVVEGGFWLSGRIVDAPEYGERVL